MLKEFAWRTFARTGDINSYMFYRNLEELLDPQKENENVKSIIEEVALASDTGA